MKGDFGLGFTGAVREALMVDTPYALEEPRGFSWWPHRLRQSVRAGEPFTLSGGLACRVSVETEVLAAGPEDAKGDAALCELSRFPPMAGFVRDGEKVVLHSALTVPAEPSRHLAPIAAVAAALQATYAELGIESLAGETGLPPAFSAHPGSGARPNPDGMLSLAAARIAPAGKERSVWADPDELVQAAEALDPTARVTGVDPRGLSARFPFRPGVPDPLSPRDSALLQVRVDAPHPELGHGVFLRLFLPSAGLAPTVFNALRLNAREREDAGSGLDVLGAWTLERSEPEITGFAVQPGPPRLAHVVFLPNFVRVKGLLAEAVLGMQRRAGRAAGWLET